MFSESEGATALRQDLIHALSLSAGPGELDGPSGMECACAALSAVWNGRKGYVAVLVRSLETPTVRRYTYADTIRSEVELDAAVDEGLAFAGSFGFVMDDPTFQALAPTEQKDRLGAWNQLRKPNRYPEFARAHDRTATPAPETSPPLEASPALDLEPDTNPDTIDLPAPVADGECAGTDPRPEEDPFDDAPAVRADVQEALAEDDADGRAVLGRISIVRRQAAGPRARLLSQF